VEEPRDVQSRRTCNVALVGITENS